MRYLGIKPMSLALLEHAQLVELQKSICLCITQGSLAMKAKLFKLFFHF